MEEFISNDHIEKIYRMNNHPMSITSANRQNLLLLLVK